MIEWWVLQSRKSPREFTEEVAREGHHYNGFNLIVADISSKAMVYVSNRPKGEPISIQDVPPGTHVLSNAKLNSPWHKVSIYTLYTCRERERVDYCSPSIFQVQRLELNFNDLVGEYGEGEIPVNEMVEKLMRDRVKAEESKLPRICSPDWELSLSSIFVEVDTPLVCITVNYSPINARQIPTETC